MRGFVGVLFLLYILAAAMSVSLGRCGIGSAEAPMSEADYCAFGVALSE